MYHLFPQEVGGRGGKGGRGVVEVSCALWGDLGVLPQKILGPLRMILMQSKGQNMCLTFTQELFWQPFSVGLG